MKKEMDKLFRQVSVKERLPEKPGVYNTDLGKLEFSTNPCYKNNGIWLKENYVNNPEIWLEEVELPSSEELKKAAENHSFTNAFKLGAQYILNTLKGEKR